MCFVSKHLSAIGFPLLQAKRPETGEYIFAKARKAILPLREAGLNSSTILAPCRLESSQPIVSGLREEAQTSWRQRANLVRGRIPPEPWTKL